MPVTFRSYSPNLPVTPPVVLYLVDENGNYILDENGNRIVVVVQN